MFAKSPIRNKLLIGLGLLLGIVAVLSWGGIRGLYAYRSLVRSLARRVDELPLANRLSQNVSNLRVGLAEMRAARDLQLPGLGTTPVAVQMGRDQFQTNIKAVKDTLTVYRTQVSEIDPEDRIGDSLREQRTVQAIEASLARIDEAQLKGDWLLDDVKHSKLTTELDHLQQMAAELPSYLHDNIREFTEHAKVQYRTLIVLSWVTSATTALILGLLVYLFYHGIFRPLRILIKGSRKVASGQFNYRIQLETQDEMSELAAAMNDMTARFRDIRDDLDCQVQERTKQVVRSEQLASVGFLAAGVAHEINNPLASIAMCAESLEGRVDDVTFADDGQRDVVRTYLKMIQDEAFRCKEITEKLLDFSRIGEVRRQETDLRELVQGVIDMLRHIGKYDDKNLVFADGGLVYASINGQEIKQVVLNLVINALDSLDPGGTVTVEVEHRDGQAVLTVTDDGCGMTPEVQEHLFEPFFTRRRNGQGTGLGLSIAFRIVADHEGSIDVHSAGPGQGSRFRVRLPASRRQKEIAHRYQAA